MWLSCFAWKVPTILAAEREIAIWIMEAPLSKISIPGIAIIFILVLFGPRKEENKSAPEKDAEVCKSIARDLNWHIGVSRKEEKLFNKFAAETISQQKGCHVMRRCQFEILFYLRVKTSSTEYKNKQIGVKVSFKGCFL